MSAFFIMFFVYMAFIFCLPVVMIIVIILLKTKKAKQISAATFDIASEHGWTYMEKSGAFTTFDRWAESKNVSVEYRDIIIGKLKESKSDFIQYQVYQSQKSSLVTRIAIQDTKIEALFVPLYGFDVTVDSLTNLVLKNSSHAFEGDFSRYFKVYYSDDEQIDLYTLFGPDVLQYIKDQLQLYSIAINGSYLFIYTDNTSALVRKEIINKADILVKELKLSLKGSNKNVSLARTAIDNKYEGTKQISKGIGSNFWKKVIPVALFIVVYFYFFNS